MNTAALKKIYEKLPESIKLSFAPFIRKGMTGNSVFKEQYDELVNADLMGADELERLQLKKLRELCIFAYENTKYYKNLFDEVSFNPLEFDSVDEFVEKVPVLEKADVLKHYDEINVSTITGDYPSSTGGSSGTRLVVNNSKECFYKENAFLCHHYLKLNYDYKKSKVAYFGGMGDTLISASPLYNMMRYNSKLINSATVDTVVESLNKTKPDFIQGLPSAIYFFCKLLNDADTSLKFTPKGVIFASENIYPVQRRYIEETFGCKSLAHYGHTERVVFGEEIPGDSDVPMYKFNPLYGYTEVDKEDGCIIGTGFINYKMPLIRYKTDDVAAFDGGVLCSIEGHRTSAMIGKSGARISAASFAHMDDIFDLIDKFQFEQFEQGKILVYLVPKRSLSEAELVNIKSIFIKKFMNNMDVELKTVEQVKLTDRGKFALLIQNIRED